ncbi:MAG: hypothetical protein AAF517_17395 [Planctomycetota bacterium]
MDQASQILEQLSEQARLQEDELTQLPRWALVALAARCARRAQPLFSSDWPDAPEEFKQSIDEALALTEASAANAEVDERLPTAGQLAGNTATTAGNLTARFASFTVAFAAVNAANVANAENNDTAVAFVQATADSCHKSATFASVRSSLLKGSSTAVAAAFNKEMRADFNALLNMSRRNEWSDSSPVNPDELGPLWRDPPAGLTEA